MKLIRRSASLVFLAWIASLSFLVHADQNLADYTAAMKRLEADFNRKSGEIFGTMIDADTILDRIFYRLEKDVEPEFITGFSKGFREKGIPNLTQRLVGMLPDRNGTHLIQVKPQGNRIYGALRLDFGDQGFGYMNFELARDRDDNTIRIVDWYDYQAGQYYTQSLRQMVATISPSPSMLGKIFDIATGHKLVSDKLLKIMKAANRKDFEAIRPIYDSFNDDLRKSWIVMVIVFNMANMSGDVKFYNGVLTDLEKNFSDDPRATFILIDYYIIREQYDLALQCIDKLNAEFSYRDAGLWYLNANIHYLKNDYPAAIESARNSIQREPDFEDAYWTLLRSQVRSGDNGSATHALGELERRFGYVLDRDALSQDADFQTYVDSPEYIRFEQSR